jgi:hypothetical protein
MKRVLTGVVLLTVLGCVPPPESATPHPEALLALTLDALERGDLNAAARHARSLPTTDTSPRGRRALLLRALVGLDPRNPVRAPNQAADAAARYAASASDPLDAAVGRLLYGLAVDLGAVPTGGGVSAGGELPRLRGPTVAARLEALERVVKELRGELARIQATLKS